MNDADADHGPTLEGYRDYLQLLARRYSERDLHP